MPAVFDRSDRNFEYPESLLLIWEQWLYGLGTMVRVRVSCCSQTGQFPDPIFMPAEKMGLETVYFIFIKLYRNAGALLFSNITLEVIEDYIPHYVPTIC